MSCVSKIVGGNTIAGSDRDMHPRERYVMRDSQPLIESMEVGTLAQAIVDTVREPLLVLDKNLRVLAAGRSFYVTFKVAPSDTQGQAFYDLGDSQWDIPGLRVLLDK